MAAVPIKDCKQLPASPRVIMVGAGFAGIEAARTLREGGIEDILVLEAQDRAGGRVQKISIDGGFVEPGAQFIHGEEGNRLYQLAHNYGLLLDESLYQGGKKSDSSAEDYLDNHFFTSDGQLIKQEIIARLVGVVNKVFRDYANSIYANSERDDVTAVQNGTTALNKGNESRETNTIITDPKVSTINQIDTKGSHIRRGEGGYGCIVDYSIPAISGKAEQDKTFLDVLKTSRDKLESSGDDPLDIKLAVLRWMEQWEYTDNAARLPELSLQAYGKYAYLPGYGLTLSSSGLEDIFHTFLTQTLQPQSLLLSKPAKTICWGQWPSEPISLEDGQENYCNGSEHLRQHETGEKSNTDNLPNDCVSGQVNTLGLNTTTTQFKNKPVRVLCEDGEEFWADHVIVTSSLGYLKKQEATLFCPTLPPAHRRAIQQMGFGTVAKVFLVWEADDLSQVLDQGARGVQFLWLDGKFPRPQSDSTAKKTKNDNAWYDCLQGFERVQSHKGMLMTWLAGEEADIMETLPEQEVKDVLYELMKQFTNNDQLPPPKSMIRSQWHSNPYILGGYSYIPAGMEPAAHNLLSTPLPSQQNPILQISGEATSHRFYSTVHGAIDAGNRAARNILRHYNSTS